MSMRNNSRLAELLEIIKRILSNQLDFKSRAAVDTDVLCGSLQVLSTLQPGLTCLTSSDCSHCINSHDSTITIWSISYTL
jgi:hypothetical protein